MIDLASLKNVSDYLTHILIVLGAFGGSVKASSNNRSDKWCIKVFNVLLGMFCGIVVAGHYSSQLSPFLAGILSLAVASVSIAVIEDVILLAPRILEWWVSNKLKIDQKELTKLKKVSAAKSPKPSKPSSE